MGHELEQIIEACDAAIKNEDFDTLMSYYTEDAVLVVRPGTVARGKAEIEEAFIRIAKYFDNSIVPAQGKMEILEAGDTALVISQTLLESTVENPDVPMERKATYIFKKDASGKWLCAIDNSYGTDLI
ncbi:DUF4440 domain-containing protein [Bacillus mangrovi]|uniref:DUF4440 domain-containing protein n=1 Tax=Metabacillus mangrovi TaxID=1491830 RepID=A0A7X2V602_9BACI|nr:DUF4440 domain-containing protein [Metabacillus mangrovi]MTH54960.1 DUF4440 domain-containing protein [Metabacillus mangrovi]